MGSGTGLAGRTGSLPADAFFAAALPAGTISPAGRPALLILGQRLLHGKADLALLIDGKHLHFDGLPLGNKVPNLSDEGGGHLGDVHHSSLAALKTDERAKFGDPCHLSLVNTSNLKLHKQKIPPRLRRIVK